MHKDNVHRRVPIEDINTFEENGWILGYSETAKENLSKSHLGNEPGNKGKHIPLEQRELLSNMWRGAKKMNNGTDVVFAKKDEIEYYLSKGYVFGGLKTTK